MEKAQDVEAWAWEEFGHAQLGHLSRVKRLVKLASEVALCPAGTVTEAFEGNSQQNAYRFLANEAVAPEEVARASHRAAALRAEGLAVVYVPGDMSSLTLTDTQRVKTGPVGKRGKGGGARGVEVISALALTADGTPLGLLGQRFWRRAQKAARRGTYDGRPPEEKESFWWLRLLEECLLVLAEVGCEATPWFQLDRGADFHLLLAFMAAHPEVKVTVRAAHNRVLWKGGKLFDVLRNAPLLGRHSLWVAPQEGRAGRHARLAVRARKVQLKLKDRRTDAVKEATLWAVEAREVGPLPRGVARLAWRLLTNHPVHTLEDALQVLEGYGLRWRVEDFHKTWKSVCRVEDTQLRKPEAIDSWASMLAANAMRIEQLKHLSRTQPDAPASVAYSQEEIDALQLLQAPDEYGKGLMPTMAQATLMLARLGGYTRPSSRGGPPGSIVLSRGMAELEVAVRTLRARALASKRPREK